MKDFANNLINSTLRCFTVRESKLLEFYPPKPQDRDSCFMWSYFATTGMLYHAIKCGFDVKDTFRQLIDGLAYYRSKETNGDFIKYHSERGEAINEGHDKCFYDDNIWVARNLLFAYEVFGDSSYLSEAKKVVEFVRRGWNEELGGVVWNEDGLTPDATVQELERGLSANACSSLVNAMLYRITNEEHYLEWAKRFYDFCKIMQDCDSKIYYNGIHTVISEGNRCNGEVNKDLYSYNSGSMILADIELYEITNDKAYLTDAVKSAESTFEAFLAKGEKCDLIHFKDFIWFTAVFTEGLYKLSKYDSNITAMQIDSFKRELISSRRYLSEQGLLPHDLVWGWRTDDDYDRMLLTHSAIAEIAVICSAINT